MYAHFMIELFGSSELVRHVAFNDDIETLYCSAAKCQEFSCGDNIKETLNKVLPVDIQFKLQDGENEDNIIEKILAVRPHVNFPVT